MATVMPQYRPLIRVAKAVLFVAVIGAGVAETLMDHAGWWAPATIVGVGVLLGAVAVMEWRRARGRGVRGGRGTML